MKIIPSLSTFAVGVLACQLLLAQTPPAETHTRPADATGLCKDGTYTIDAVKSGACHGHHGVKEWYATTPAAPAPSAPDTTPNAAAPPATAAAPSPTTQARTQSQAAAQRAGQSGEPLETQSINKDPAASTPAASGGGPGMVWLNNGSKIYHCPGTRYYGKTKHGAYMSEADAKAKGAHIARGEVCNQ